MFQIRFWKMTVGGALKFIRWVYFAHNLGNCIFLGMNFTNDNPKMAIVFGLAAAIIVEFLFIAFARILSKTSIRLFQIVNQVIIMGLAAMWIIIYYLKADMDYYFVFFLIFNF